MVSRSKLCAYRHCNKPFEDTTKKNSAKFCCAEHRRREKAFRLGHAKDESYFRESKEIGWRRCQSCGERWKRVSGDRAVRCPACRSASRDKVCRRCGQDFRDESSKNTRRFCSSCKGPKGRGRAKVSDRTGNARRRRVEREEGGRLDRFESVVPFSQTWWGRVGELLFLHAYPDAHDAIEEYGNRAPFDAQHQGLGRVDVKTATAGRTSFGKLAWSFQVGGVNRNSDSSFMVGFSEARDHVERVWLAPSCELPDRLKVMSPGSREYRHGAWEQPGLVPLLDRKLQSILSSVGRVRPVTDNGPRIEYERVILGRIGEAIYKRLNPTSNYVTENDPLAPIDFKDVDGATVNVRLRRRTGRGRWTFTRSSSPVDAYFFVGLDSAGRVVEALYRVPSGEMPPRGFSVRLEGESKWDRFREDPLGLPLPVTDLVGLPDLEEIHVRITSLNQQSVQGLAEDGVETLLEQAVRYHRFLGFPFPAIPSDKRLASDVQRVLAYEPKGKDLPVENGGLGTCSAYMPHRFEARNSSADFSAVGAFWDEGRLRRALRFCLRGKSPNLTRAGLRSALTALNRTPTSFRPAVAKALVQHYAPPGGVVFDPCAGWGGRMMGALVAGGSYVGVEPVSKTVAALYRLGGRLCEHLEVERSKVRLIESPIQALPDGALEADFALTSPPYWTKEVYEGRRERISVDAWVEDFLRPMFEKVRTILRPGARFAVNIVDVRDGEKEIPLERLAKEAAEASGFGLEAAWRMMKSSFGGQAEGRFEPVLVFCL